MNEVRFPRNEGHESSGPTKHPTQGLKIVAGMFQDVGVLIRQNFPCGCWSVQPSKILVLSQIQILFFTSAFEMAPCPLQLCRFRLSPERAAEWKEQDSSLSPQVTCPFKNKIILFAFKISCMCTMYLDCIHPRYLFPCPLIHLPPSFMSTSLLFL